MSRFMFTANVRAERLLIVENGRVIVQKWIDYFVLHRPIEPRKITHRIK